MATPTHYQLLGVAAHATREEIKRRFRALARKMPDVAEEIRAACRRRTQELVS